MRSRSSSSRCCKKRLRAPTENVARLALPFLFASIFMAACGGGSEASSDPAMPTSGALPEENAEPADDSGTLDVISDEPTKVLLDGKPIGTTPVTGYKVAPGSHDVTFVDERRGNRTMAVTIEPSQSHTVKADNAPTKFVAPPEPEGEKKP
jgi:hypothetical protein